MTILSHNDNKWSLSFKHSNWSWCVHSERYMSRCFHCGRPATSEWGFLTAMTLYRDVLHELIHLNKWGVKDTLRQI